MVVLWSFTVRTGLAKFSMTTFFGFKALSIVSGSSVLSSTNSSAQINLLTLSGTVAPRGIAYTA